MYIRAIACLSLLAVIVFGLTAPASAQAKQQKLVDDAAASVTALRADGQIGPALDELLPRAKGVVVIPRLFKGGFIVGGEAGNGVLLGRLADGAWSAPAFVEVAAASIGLQIGGSASRVILMIMTDKGFEAIMRNNLKFGAGASAAAGPIGAQVQAATTTSVGADIYSYALSKGAFAGLALDGGATAAKEPWNEAYYGTALSTRAIVTDASLVSQQADALRIALEE